MANNLKLNNRFTQLNCCVIIPTYNNEKTIEKVILDTLEFTDRIIIVNDGATDTTPQLISKYKEQLTIITQSVNKGKGMALRTAFIEASKIGYRYAITIDSDGQHFPNDFELFLNEIEKNPDALIIGARNMNSENVPGKSSFGNKFSNFWFWVETGIKMPDTQSGYRLYPIQKLEKIHFFTNRFEFEIEVIVKASWNRIPVTSIPIQVYYAVAGERISHFRPGKDFTRISFLNTYLVALAFLFYKPLKFFRQFSWSNIVQFCKDNFLNPSEPIWRQALSVSVGMFFGIVPIWGYQLVSAIAAAYFLKLNKPVVIVVANISFPPMIPIILIASIKTGEFFTGIKSTFTIDDITLENVKSNLYVYMIGACILSIISAIISGVLAYVLLYFIRKKYSANYLAK